MEEALKSGDEEAIKEADYNWRIVTSAFDDIREENRFFNEPSLVQQLIYGQEERGETVPEKLTSVVSIDCGFNSKTCTPTSEVKVLSPRLAETSRLDSRMKEKTNNHGCYYQ